MKGTIPILATPFNDDETLDLDSLSRLIEFMVGLGVDGVTVLGVLGESNRLAEEERAAVVKTAVATTQGKIPVVVGTSHSGTGVVKRYSRIAQDVGADAVMVTP